MFDVRTLGKTVAFETDPEPVEPRRFAPRLFADLQVHAENAWLIKGVLPATGWGLLFGPSGTGKSFVALDLIAAIGTGASWNGRRVRQGGAVYVALEGVIDAEHRMVALREHAGVCASSPIAFIDAPLQLTERSDVEALIAELDAVDFSIRLVVIDTFARATAGIDENDAGQVGCVIDAAEEISRALGCLVLLVHHAPWDAKRPRGSTALVGAADVVLHVSRSNDERKVAIQKLKAGRDGDAWSFALEDVHLGEDADGDPIATCVIDWRQGATVARPSQKLSAKQIISKRGLIIALQKCGQSLRGHAGENVVAVPRATWRREAISAGVTDAETEKNQNDAARRIEDALISRRIVAHRDGFVWLCDDATDCDEHATVASSSARDHATDATAPSKAVASVAVASAGDYVQTQEISTKAGEDD